MCGSTSGVYPNSSGARHLLRSILMVTRKRKSAKAGSGKQAFERHHFNYGRWTKSRFSEAVTVTGPAKMIFLAGIGSEHEQTGKIMHPGDFTAHAGTPTASSRKSLHAMEPPWPTLSNK